MNMEKGAGAYYDRSSRLDGRGFVVLGAGQGIGLESCRALRQAGADLVCVDRDEALAAAVAEETGGLAHRCDVTRRDDMERLFETAAGRFGEAFGGVVDIVGIADVRPLAEMDDDGWNRQFDIVLRHAYLALQIGARYVAPGGSFVFVSSMSGDLSVENQSTYGVSKAALNHLVRCAAHELGAARIRVNAVAPGFVKTPRLRAALPEAFWADLEQHHIPLGRAALPQDIANAILYLASDMSACVTGAILPVDGGVSKVAALPRIPLTRKAEAT